MGLFDGGDEEDLGQDQSGFDNTSDQAAFQSVMDYLGGGGMDDSEQAMAEAGAAETDAGGAMSQPEQTDAGVSQNEAPHNLDFLSQATGPDTAPQTNTVGQTGQDVSDKIAQQEFQDRLAQAKTPEEQAAVYKDMQNYYGRTSESTQRMDLSRAEQSSADERHAREEEAKKLAGASSAAGKTTQGAGGGKFGISLGNLLKGKSNKPSANKTASGFYPQSNPAQTLGTPSYYSDLLSYLRSMK